MKWLNGIIRWVLTQRLKQIDKFVRFPFETQYRTLTQLINSAKNTEFGKKHQFSVIKNYQDFQKNVPIFPYENLFPYIERMLKGEPNILWASPVKWFSKSSGTTNARSKFIPVSYDTLYKCHMQGGKDMIALYLMNVPFVVILSEYDA
jgi:hypothetical protein